MGVRKHVRTTKKKSTHTTAGQVEVGRCLGRGKGEVVEWRAVTARMEN